MKKSKLALAFIWMFLSTASFADEGMWIPSLLAELNKVNDMQSRGMKLSAEDIYSINKSSLKDAIVSFGGFCTAEVISKEGLILTNHHCGYGQIQSHSSVKNDYLTHGFWAMNRKDELSNPGLTATFIISIEDVTDKILEGVTSEMTESQRNDIIQKNSKKMNEQIKSETGYGSIIRSFFYGNKYYLFVTETFKDVRLVGTPPSSIGKFGGDTDNWMWPRHTGDFSLFRIYADKNNKPADYSQDNIPLQPRHHLPVSLKGVEKGDFTMVFGFPGRTQEYLTSYAVKHIMEISNPVKIALRDERLKTMDKYMKSSDEVRIKYAAKYASVSNYHKKWIGENRGLERLDAIKTKENFEKMFTDFSTENKQYAHVLKDFKAIYDNLNDVSLARDYLTEAAFAIENFTLAKRFFDAIGVAKDPTADAKKWEAALKNLKEFSEKHFKNYDASVDKEITYKMLEMYDKGIPKQYKSPIFETVISKHKNFKNYADYLFGKSILVDKSKTDAFIEKATPKTILKIEKDPSYQLMYDIYNFYLTNLDAKFKEENDKIDILNRTYLKAMMEMQKDKVFYPDANSTLRISFGQVDNYAPRDAVVYDHYTTIEGIIEKSKQVGQFEDYEIPAKLKELYDNKDFGEYTDAEGYMPVCFIASNHTTGGNSGSPVIDANGNLIGLNFDRTWESTMSDIMYDPEKCRNVAVDTRYILFVIDKYAGAKHLINEMTILK